MAVPRFGNPGRFDPVGAKNAPAFIGVSGKTIPSAQPARAPKVAPKPKATSRAPRSKPVNLVKAKTAPPKQPVLAPTSARTTVPARTITAAPPKAKAPAPKPAAQPAVQPQQLSPAAYANQQVTASLAPLYQQETTQATGQNTAITSLTKAIIAALAGTPGLIGQDYNQAIGQQTNLANAAAQSLRNVNPNTQDQAILSAINAPQAQQAQVADQNNNTFNGGAAVGQYVGGVLPASSLQGQKLAATSFARTLPAIEGLRGQQALSTALTNQAADRQKIDAMKPQLIQQYQQSYTDALQKQQQLDYDAQSLGLKTQNQLFTQNVTKQKLAISKQAAGKIDSSVSKILGYASTANGSPVTKGGKIIPVNASTGSQGVAKVPTASQISNFVDAWKTGKTATVRVPVVDKSGKPVLNSNGVPQSQVKTVTVKQLQYGQAYVRLRAMGIKDKKARTYLDTAYQRGDQGRAWVTNEEQATLRKAKLPPKAKIVNGHGVLTVAQAHALQKAGQLPAGQQTSDGFYVIAQTF